MSADILQFPNRQPIRCTQVGQSTGRLPLAQVLPVLPAMLRQIHRRVSSAEPRQLAAARAELSALAAYFDEINGGQSHG